MPPALKVRASGANGTRPPAEPLHPVLPNATENPEYNKIYPDEKVRHALHYDLRMVIRIFQPQIDRKIRIF